MKFLIITPYTPYPPNSGGRMRIWEELRFLSARHELTLVAFYQRVKERNSYQALSQICCRVFLVERPGHPMASDLAAFHSVSDLFQWYTTPEMTRVLQSLQSESFDLVLLHHIFVAQYRDWLNAPAVLEEQNIESSLFQQHAQANDLIAQERTFRQARWLLLRSYETTLWKHFPLRIVVSENDRQEMERRCKAGRTIIVENGINASEIQLLPPPQSRTLLFMGSLDFYANIDAVYFLRETIMPLLWMRDSTLSLVIAGRRPPRAIYELADDPRIQVMADPDDMTAVARTCAITLAPMRIGSGTRVKILHSLALGLPVVTTPRGCEGLAVTDGCELLVRAEPEAFADAVIELLRNHALAERLRRAGRALVETHYDWAKILGKYESELIALANSP